MAAGAPFPSALEAPGVPCLKASAKRVPPGFLGGALALPDAGAAEAALVDGLLVAGEVRAIRSMALDLGGVTVRTGTLRGSGFRVSILRGSGFFGSGFTIGRGLGGSITRETGCGGKTAGAGSGAGAASPMSGASSGAALADGSGETDFSPT